MWLYALGIEINLNMWFMPIALLGRTFVEIIKTTADYRKVGCLLMCRTYLLLFVTAFFFPVTSFAAGVHLSGSSFESVFKKSQSRRKNLFGHISGSRSRPFVKPHKKLLRPAPQETLEIENKDQSPEEIINGAWKSFKRRYGKHWVIVWDRKTGLPYKILGNKTPAFEGSEGEIARKFLRENHALFALTPEIKNLQLVGESSNETAGGILFLQKCHGLEVFNGKIRIFINGDKEVTKVVSHLKPLQGCGNKLPGGKIVKSYAKAIAFNLFKKRYNTPDKTKTMVSEVVYFDGNSLRRATVLAHGDSLRRAVLAWKVSMQNADGAVLYVIDANSAVVLRRDLVR